MVAVRDTKGIGPNETFVRAGTGQSERVEKYQSTVS